MGTGRDRRDHLGTPHTLIDSTREREFLRYSARVVVASYRIIDFMECIL
jgi:hypothetical protein